MILSNGSDQLARVLYRPIVFTEPERVVSPPSWLEHIPFAFWIVDVHRPRIFVELGTQSGNSYSSFAQAVQTLGLPTAAFAVDTWQGDAHAGYYDESVFAEWSAYHDTHFAAFSSLIRTTFDQAVRHFGDRSIDLLHLDGCHTYEAAAADFQLWLPKMSDRGVVLLHDVNVRERDFGTWRLWAELREQYPCFEFLHGHGLGVLGIGSDLPHPLRWLFERHAAGSSDVQSIREFFARLGALVSARFEAAEMRAETEREIHARETLVSEREATVSKLTAEVALLREESNRREEGLQQELRALRLETAKRDEELQRARANESELRERCAVLDDELTRTRDQHTQLQRQLRFQIAKFSHRGSRRGGAAGRLSGRSFGGWRSGLKSLARLPPAVGVWGSAGNGTGHSASQFLAHPRKVWEAHIVLASGLFDEAHYLHQKPHDDADRLAPLADFILGDIGARRSPHPLFDTDYYLSKNPDVAAAGVNPLVHFLVYGAFERRQPHPLFDTAYYLFTNPDVHDLGINPLAHFLRVGAAEGRNPNPYFDCAFYLSEYPDVAAAGMNPLVHFVCSGWKEGRHPAPSFDTTYYLEAYDDVRRLGQNPLAHYLEHGQFEGRRIQPVRSERRRGR